MSFESYKTLFDRDGFVIVRRLLAPPEFDELRAQLDRYIRDVVPALPDSDAFFDDRSRPETLKQMQNLNSHDPFFADYMRNPTWIALAEALLCEPAGSQGVEWFNKPPGGRHETPPHQDNYYFNLKPPNVSTLWMAIDRVDRENGCLRYVQGSQRGGLRPHAPSTVLGFSQRITDYGPEDRLGEVEIHLEPGDVVAHHAEIIHRADANVSPTRNRRAVAMVFRGASSGRDEEGYARYREALREQHLRKGLRP